MPDKELNSFMHRSPFYVIKYRSYKCFKMVSFLTHPVQNFAEDLSHLAKGTVFYVTKLEVTPLRITGFRLNLLHL